MQCKPDYRTCWKLSNSTGPQCDPNQTDPKLLDTAFLYLCLLQFVHVCLEFLLTKVTKKDQLSRRLF